MRRKNSRGKFLFVVWLLAQAGCGGGESPRQAAANIPATNPPPNAVTPPVSGHLTASPLSLNFGEVLTGQSAALTVRLRNSGAASLTVSSIVVAGAGYSTQGISAGQVLARDAFHDFTVIFAPPSGGNFPGTVTITSDADNPTLAIALAGTGLEQIRRLSANPASIHFGEVQLSSTSSAAIQLTNTGNVPLQISGLRVTGSGFSITSGPEVPFSLLPGLSVHFILRFAPVTAGEAVGVLQASADAMLTAAEVSIGGIGVSPPAGELNISPAGLNFGNVLVGGQAAQTIGIKNTGAAVLTLTGIRSDNPAFTVTNVALPLLLPIGAQEFFGLRFSPQSAGSSTAAISFVSDAANSPSISVSGTGIEGTLLLWDASAAPGLAGYNVYRARTAGGPYTKLTTVPVQGTSFQDWTVQLGQTYFYVVRAVDSDGIESGDSNEVVKVIPP